MSGSLSIFVLMPNVIVGLSGRSELTQSLCHSRVLDRGYRGSATLAGVALLRGEFNDATHG